MMVAIGFLLFILGVSNFFDELSFLFIVIGFMLIVGGVALLLWSVML